MLPKLRNEWRAFKASPPGTRFQIVHEKQTHAPGWVRPVLILGAIAAFAIGILLTVMPGPAVVFYALAGALAATESRWVARSLDRGEIATRKLLARLRRRRSQRPSGSY